MSELKVARSMGGKSNNLLDTKTTMTANRLLDHGLARRGYALPMRPLSEIRRKRLRQLIDEVADGNILGLVEKFLRSGVIEDGVFKPTSIGTPQGGVISPLLANIVLNHFDWQLHEAGYQFVRYADDCVPRRRGKEAMMVT